MKKNFKLVLALVLSVMMVLSMTSAMADLILPEGAPIDTSITITGLDDGDQVTLYRIIKYANNAAGTSAGWVLDAPFAGVTACEAVLAKINASVNEPYALTQADVKAFTDVIKTTTPTPVTGGSVSDGTFTYTIPGDDDQAKAANMGMFIALVKPVVAGTLYNPIIVSADYTSNSTNSIDSSAKLGVAADSRAVIKKETTTINKEQNDVQDDPSNATKADNDNGYNVGDTVDFTVTTTIPVYADIYVNPSFTVTDTMSSGLDYKAGTLKVYEEDGTTEIAALNASGVLTPPSAGGTTWKLDVPSSYIKALTAAQNIVIKYSAVINPDAIVSVNEEINTVEVQFSNNPNNDSDKGKVKDETREYTFTIDGNLLGRSGIKTSELVKVAVDGNGNPIYQSSSTNETYEHALKDAVFALYTNSNCSTLYNNDVAGVDFGHIVTDSNGYMYIPGLEDGEYWLKELTAPTGYIKDMSIHHIVISTEYETVTRSEAGYPDWTVRELKSYTITIDDVNTSTYSMTLDGPITVSEIEASNALLNNTKGIELPSTGGIGTTIFYVGGSLLVLAAAILLITKRRMSSND